MYLMPPLLPTPLCLPGKRRGGAGKDGISLSSSGSSKSHCKSKLKNLRLREDVKGEGALVDATSPSLKTMGGWDGWWGSDTGSERFISQALWNVKAGSNLGDSVRGQKRWRN